MNNTFLSDYCPFCGSKDYRLEKTEFNKFFVYCTICGSRTDIYESEIKAMDAWENRVKLDPCLYRELEKNVLNWANDKNLLKPENAKTQSMKIIEEIGETYRAYLKNDFYGLQDGIGDVVVTLIIFAAQNKMTLEGCLLMAWNEIKDRTGKTVDGTFIKDK